MTPKAKAVLNGLIARLQLEQRTYYGYHRRAHENRAEQLARQCTYESLHKAIDRMKHEYDNGYLH